MKKPLLKHNSGEMVLSIVATIIVISLIYRGINELYVPHTAHSWQPEIHSI